ncbi:hypothetical protein BDQ12DRAFT_319570 [Crucibulum laeve]|uniref:Uncharacterized protein n=1 Tax=Crucibulum laeve TaxID=68775 RepID=A0A5C3LDI8_9AGAR|nr:hypothetical protein BDQ12DRAFT_319570 [Crucibulum laeve]
MSSTGMAEDADTRTPTIHNSPLRRRAMTSVDLGRPKDLINEHGLAINPAENVSAAPDPRSLLVPLRLPRKPSAAQLSLRLAIPSDDYSPQSSNSPETPATLSSPITGIVDLTRYLKTHSSSPVAQGGLSDIYKGEWERQSEEDGRKESVLVAIKLLRVLSVKDQEGARARKVNWF